MNKNKTLIEGKIKALLPKIKELQKTTGIRRANIYLIQEYAYSGHKLAPGDIKVKIYIKSPLAMREAAWKFESECNILLDEFGIHSSITPKNCLAGYPLYWDVPFINVVTGETYVLKNEQGQHLLLLLYRFARFRDNSVPTMCQLVELFEHHPEWKKVFKVALFFVGAESSEAVKALVPAEVTRAFDCYYKYSLSENDTLRWAFKQEPEFILTSKEGMVEVYQKLGYGSLEDYIVRLLKGECLWEKKGVRLMKVTSEELLGKVELFMQSREPILKDQCILDECTVSTKMRFDLFSNMNTERVPTCSIKLECLKGSQRVMENVLEEFRILFSKRLVVSQTLRVIRGSCVEAGEVCEKCGKSIHNSAQFCCTECTTRFYLCYACGSLPKEPRSVADLPHQHVLLFMPKEATVSPGKIVYHKIATKMPVRVAGECDGCGEIMLKIGWACLNCTVMLCHKCFMIGRDPAEEGHMSLENKLMTLGHSINEHVYEKRRIV